eukprot:scaffold16062_cov81-Phaeocystis_antarctica.AAC.3
MRRLSALSTHSTRRAASLEGTVPAPARAYENSPEAARQKRARRVGATTTHVFKEGKYTNKFR